jgi:hypothetical protein
MNEHAFYPVNVICHADIFKNIDRRVAQDLVTILTDSSDTTKAVIRQAIDRMDYDGLGKLLMSELNHYRANRGQS